MEDTNKVLVIGSNSFTGSHFVNHILENTDAKVIGISRSDEYDPIFLPYAYKKLKTDRFTFHKLDLNTQIKEITALIDKEKPDVVVNYAAQGEVRNSWKWPEQWFKTNCLGIVNLCNMLKDKPFLKKYIAISTPEIYGSTKKGLKETYELNPSTPYAASKAAGDLFLMAIHKKYNFPVIFIRSTNVYGIHQQLFRIIPKTIISIKKGETLTLHGRGKSVRTYLHVRDAADATLKAIQNGKPGEIYHIAPKEEGISVADLVKTLCKFMGKKFEDVAIPVEENFGQDAMYSLDATKAKKELGWSSKIEFENGLKEVITWINDNWEKIKSLPSEYLHKDS